MHTRPMGAYEVLNSFRQDIDEVGYGVAAVTGDVTGCDWAYSVGLDHSFDHPELIVIGVEAPLAGAIVQALADKVVLGIDLRQQPGARIGPMTFRFDDVDDVFRSQGDWFNLGREIVAEFGERWPDTIQVVWADDEGRFPGSDGVDDSEWFLRQPLLV